MILAHAGEDHSTIEAVSSSGSDTTSLAILLVVLIAVVALAFVANKPRK